MRKIPSRFSLMGHEITVSRREDLVEDLEVYGRWFQSRNLIEVQADHPDFSKDVLMQTFWHEAVHAALDTLGYTELSCDEEFVDRLGQAIHQIIKTKR